MRTNPQTPQGVAKRHSDWDDITEVSSIVRSTLQAVPNYRLFKAATRATAASPQARLLLVHLIGYLGADRVDDPQSRSLRFPANPPLLKGWGIPKAPIRPSPARPREKEWSHPADNARNRRAALAPRPPLSRTHNMSEKNTKYK